MRRRMPAVVRIGEMHVVRPSGTLVVVHEVPVLVVGQEDIVTGTEIGIVEEIEQVVVVDGY